MSSIPPVGGGPSYNVGASDNRWKNGVADALELVKQGRYSEAAGALDGARRTLSGYGDDVNIGRQLSSLVYILQAEPPQTESRRQEIISNIESLLKR